MRGEGWGQDLGEMEDAIFKERQERELGFRAREKVNYVLLFISGQFNTNALNLQSFKSLGLFLSTSIQSIFFPGQKSKNSDAHVWRPGPQVCELPNTQNPFVAVLDA